MIALAIEGKTLSSRQLANRMEHLTVQGESHLVFIIGGSLGLDERVIARADELLSFSAMTFPHQLMRVILLSRSTGVSGSYTMNHITNRASMANPDKRVSILALFVMFL